MGDHNECGGNEMNEEGKMSEQELALTIQILQQQTRILASNVETLSVYLHELTTSLATLEGMKTLKEGDQILVPIGASNFVFARIEDTGKVIVGVGAQACCDRSLDDAIAAVQEKVTSTESRIKENQEAYMKAAEKLEELSAEAQKLLEKKGENV